MTCTFWYKTVHKTALRDVAYRYFAERLSPIHTITQIDLDTISMNKPMSDIQDIYTIPTKIHSTLTYDFTKDRNGIIPIIQYRTAGKTKEEIASILQNIPEIGSYTIAIRPFWSNTATSVVSRIAVTLF